MTARIINREMFFRFRRTENDIERIIAIADKAAAEDAIGFVTQVVARTKAAIEDEEWRRPSDCEGGP